MTFFLSKLYDRSTPGMCLAIENGHCLIFLLQMQRTVITEHAFFDRTSYPYVGHPKNFMKVLDMEPQMEEEVNKEITVLNVSKPAIESKKILKGRWDP